MAFSCNHEYISLLVESVDDPTLKKKDYELLFRKHKYENFRHNPITVDSEGKEPSRYCTLVDYAILKKNIDVLRVLVELCGYSIAKKERELASSENWTKGIVYFDSIPIQDHDYDFHSDDESEVKYGYRDLI